MTAIPFSVKPSPPKGEQRVIFYHLNWQAYQQVLQAVGENRSARLSYNQGTLEITMPLEEHEFYSALIGRFIYFLVAATGGKIKTMGSTTLNREDLDRGAEPDNAFFLVRVRARDCESPPVAPLYSAIML